MLDNDYVIFLYSYVSTLWQVLNTKTANYMATDKLFIIKVMFLLQMKIKKYEAKQERRREQNRRAAQRSREKRKAEGDYLSKVSHFRDIWGRLPL